ncbi:MAG: hypothetical protein WAX69_23545 [Victivallales bacterium]
MKRKHGIDRLNIAPVPQEDGVSCGYCALLAVYNYYRLGDRNLRVRLGVDHGFLPCLPGRDKLEKFLHEVKAGIGKYKYADAHGTYPPDMFAVLNEDGFKMDTLVVSDIDYRNRLRRHIASGHPALVLVEWGHWIVISDVNSRGVRIVDSLRTEPYSKPYKWCSDNITGIILVSRKKKARCRRSNADCARGYLQGALFVMKMAGKDIPLRLENAFRPGIRGKRSGTLVGNAINHFFKWDEGTIVGNWVNHTFG